jgi:Na+/proline symporter/signal transduction histidine kinase/CheY-like chemotaxis protein
MIMTNINIDLALVLGYLVLTFWLGLAYSKGVINIRTLALGGRNFSTGALTASITATYVSGSSFVVGITQGYQDGILNFLAATGIVVNMLVIVYVLIPRMSEFIGEVSIASAMQGLFGRKVGIITGIFALSIPIGMVAMQIKILASNFKYFVGINPEAASLLCALVMVCYSAYGGIRAVIMTNILQFVTFMIVVPGIGIALWSILSSQQSINMPGEIYNHAITMQSASGKDYLTLFLLFLMPGFSQAFFQRIAVSKNVKQASDAYKYSAYIYLIYIFIATLIGMMLFVYHPGLSELEIFPFMLDQFTFPGLRGLIFIALIAMTMSTADSHINSFGVIFSHDICKQMGFAQTDKQELRLAQTATIVVGIMATILAIYFQDILQILLFASNFYVPVVTPIFVPAILGFRSSSRAALIGMTSGFGVVVIWKLMQFYNPTILIIDSLVPSAIVNFITYFAAHYLLEESGGWVGPNDLLPLEFARVRRNKIWKNIWSTITGFISVLCFQSESRLLVDKRPGMRSLLGVLIIASNGVVTISDPTIAEYKYYIHVMRFFSYAIGAAFILAPSWVSESDKYGESLTLYSLLYFVGSNCLLMLACSFSNISMVSFIASSFAVAFFGRVFFAVLIIFISIIIAYLIFMIQDNSTMDFSNTNFRLVLFYIAFAMAFLLLPFMVRKQNEIDIITASDTKLRRIANVLRNQIALRDRLLKQGPMDTNILRNINHEVKIPIDNMNLSVDSLVKNLHKPGFEKYAEETVMQLKFSMVKLYKYISNILDLSEYQTDGAIFDIKPRNFRNFLQELVEKDENISLKYSPDAPEIIEFDELRMRELFEALIDNAKKFGGYDIIEISVMQDQPIVLNNASWERIKISVRDSGVGIPHDEIEFIFRPFYISSRTKSKVGGRGLGLTLAKAIAAAHLGEIYAENNKEKGATIFVLLPIIHPTSPFVSGVKFVDSEGSVPEIDLRQIIDNEVNIEAQFSGRIPKILMIEDEEDLREMGGLIVESLGCEFIGTATGEEAVSYIMSKEFDADIVLLDMMLGDTDGLEVMKKICKKLKNLDIPVVIQSGILIGNNMIKETLRLGARDLINKPYSRKSFEDMLKKHLDLG